jgi:Ca2+-dependent lipid-binding protein
MDAYCVWHFDYMVGSKEKNVNRTSTKKNTRVPAWSETYEFEYECQSSSMMRERFLTVDVYDANLVILDKLLGRIRVSTCKPCFGSAGLYL